MQPNLDAIGVGTGHKGLVAALVLARAGRSVLVLERAAVIGGATRTERPFARAPDLPQSTGAYLLGLMPPELERLLGIEIRDRYAPGTSELVVDYQRPPEPHERKGPHPQSASVTWREAVGR